MSELTPALARATKAVHNDECGCEYDGDHPDETSARWGASARAAVSAALHDPDDPDWLAKVIDDAALMRTGRSIGILASADVADAVRAAILGEA
jgi:hypothetical protein